jgi:hypothetical protein
MGSLPDQKEMLVDLRVVRILTQNERVFSLEIFVMGEYPVGEIENSIRLILMVS